MLSLKKKIKIKGRFNRDLKESSLILPFTKLLKILNKKKLHILLTKIKNNNFS